jgi:hypothetical protein
MYKKNPYNIYIYIIYTYTMSDNYEFLKSNEAQDATDYSHYVDKQYNNYINDINNGVYTNNSLTLVKFDLGQIYNSLKFTQTGELFAILPIAVVAGFSTGSARVAPTERSQALCSIKSNFLNLIHQAVTDLATLGHSIRFAPTLDNPKAAKYSKTFANTASASGNGLSKNRVFANTSDNQTAIGA